MLIKGVDCLTSVVASNEFKSFEEKYHINSKKEQTLPQNCAKAIILGGETVSWRNLKSSTTYHSPG